VWIIDSLETGIGGVAHIEAQPNSARDPCATLLLGTPLIFRRIIEVGQLGARRANVSISAKNGRAAILISVADAWLVNSIDGYMSRLLNPLCCRRAGEILAYRQGAALLVRIAKASRAVAGPTLRAVICGAEHRLTALTHSGSDKWILISGIFWFPQACISAVEVLAQLLIATLI